MIDASLSATTNCRIDISTPHGLADPFAVKRHSGKVKVFTLRWQDDPRKGAAWYARQVERLEPVSLAQEIDINYAASLERALIPSTWLQAAVGAHLRLGSTRPGCAWARWTSPTRGKKGAFAGRRGILLERLVEWSGKGGDVFDTTCRAFALCEELGYERFSFDSDGLGSGCRGDARIINEQREAASKQQIVADPYRGSSGPAKPEGSMVPGRKNQDFFANMKAMSWWSIRERFRTTHAAVTSGRAAARRNHFTRARPAAAAPAPG